MLTLSAAEIVGKNLKKGAIVVLESTVYPGVTEEIVKPILEEESGMKCGVDFKIGYSPERINPGDKEHTTDRITKIVAGMDEETTERLAKLYGLITNVYKAKDIKTAEAAKVIENIQRDLNTLFLFRKKKTCAKRKNNSFFGKAFFSKERFVIITVAHDAFKPFLRNNPLLVKVFSLEKKLMNNDPILIDIRGIFSREDAEKMGFCYRSL